MFMLIDSKCNIISGKNKNINFLHSKVAIFIEFLFAFQAILNFSKLWASESHYKPYRQIFIMILHIQANRPLQSKMLLKLKPQESPDAGIQDLWLKCLAPTNLSPPSYSQGDKQSFVFFKDIKCIQIQLAHPFNSLVLFLWEMLLQHLV